MFRSAGCSLLRAEGFSCSLDVLYGGLGISKLQLLLQKISNFFPAVSFFSIYGHKNLGWVWMGNGIQPAGSGSGLDNSGFG
jgi:hypothetical protein